MRIVTAFILKIVLKCSHLNTDFTYTYVAAYTRRGFHISICYVIYTTQPCYPHMHVIIISRALYTLSWNIDSLQYIFSLFRANPPLQCNLIVMAHDPYILILGNLRSLQVLS